MGLETREREIDGILFTVKLLPFEVARPLLVRATGLIGPALSELGGAEATGDGVGAMARAFGALGTKLSVKDMDYLDETLGPVSEIQGENGMVPLTKQAIRVHFQGRQLLWFKWVAFALEVQFSDFFDAVRRFKAARDQRPNEAPAA